MMTTSSVVDIALSVSQQMGCDAVPLSVHNLWPTKE